MLLAQRVHQGSSEAAAPLYLRRQFEEHKHIHAVKSNTLMEPISVGGLGLRNLVDITKHAYLILDGN